MCDLAVELVFALKNSNEQNTTLKVNTGVLGMLLVSHTAVERKTDFRSEFYALLQRIWFIVLLEESGI